MAIVGTMGTARSKGECVTHAKSLILKVVGSQQLASIFCRKLLLAPPKPQNFPAARAQGGGLRPGSATLTATIIHAGPHTPSMSRGHDATAARRTELPGVGVGLEDRLWVAVRSSGCLTPSQYMDMDLGLSRDCCCT